MKIRLILLSLAALGAFLFALCTVLPMLAFFSALGSEKEYDLSAKDFGSKTLQMVEHDSGLRLPPGAQGLNFHYIPPMDPIWFARIKIPPDSRKFVQDQIEKLQEVSPWPESSIDERCPWWPKTFNGVLISRKATPGNFFLEAYLAEQEGALILYLQYSCM